MTLKEAQTTVDNWIKTYGVRYFNELTNMACLTEEVGELARIMARRYGEQSFKPGEPTDPSDEMADVLWGSSAWPTRPASTSPKLSVATLKRRPAATPHATSKTRNSTPKKQEYDNTPPRLRL